MKEHEKAAVVGQTMREAEIKVQTMMEENEALTFNNDRLTKRVAILQKEVNEVDNSIQKISNIKILLESTSSRMV